MILRVNTNYDAALKQIKCTGVDTAFYGELHPELMPYVGENYDKTGILLVGESHYIGRAAPEEFKALDWYNNPVPENGENPFRKYISWFDTRAVIRRYMEHERGKGHMIFSDPAKAIMELKPEIVDDCEAFTYFAFMNYFQRPALEKGKSISADENDKKYAADLLDKVFEVLKPKTVIFLSKKAYWDYMEWGRTEEERKLYAVAHPTSPWWNRKDNNGECGRGSLKKILESVIA